MSEAKSETTELGVWLFGGFEVRQGGEPLSPLRSRREQWLLALLVLRHDRDTSRAWLAATLWPDNDEAQALFYLRKSLSNLRLALGASTTRLLSPTPRTIRLDMTGAFADVIVFDNVFKKNAAEIAASARLQEAIALYRGPLLPDCLEEWAARERTTREQNYLTALEALAIQYQKQDAPASAVHWLRLLTAADPYRESAYRLLMQALADCGDLTAVRVVYQELRARLREDINTIPDPETEALYRRISDPEKQPVASLAQPAAPRESRRHLPVPLSDLIGRKTEIAQVLDWLNQRRLVTLLGAGGIGKTRLAIAAAEAALPRFEQGVWFVDLAALSDPDLVPQVTANALGITEESGRSLTEALTDSLAPRALLLVLDNCEHLLEACAKLAYALLSSCPALHILATSRQALDVIGEQVYRVPSLLVPPHESVASEDGATLPDMDVHRLMEYEAIQLFVDRASRVNSASRFHARNVHAVVEICRQLDGIPLAIEMAAARMRSLSVSEINARLDQRFRLLTSGNRGVLPRHQTLRAAIDWSYEQLSEAEKALLCRLSVFAGGCTAESAAAICKDTHKVLEEDIADLLGSLADKSLVVLEMRNEATRYSLLETIRQYASDRLTESAEVSLFRERHRDYFLTLTETSRAKLMGPEQAQWLTILDAEYDNLRQALAFCREDLQSGGEGLRLGAALWRFWIARGYMTEGRSYYSAALSHPGALARSLERAEALNGAGVLAFYQGDYLSASPLHEESLAIARELGDRKAISIALSNRGNIAATQGDYPFARALFEEGLAIWRELGESKGGIANLLNNLGNIANEQGDFEAALALQEESLQIERELGNRQGVASTLNNLGILAEGREDFAAARALYEESLEIHRELGPRFAEASNLCGLGNVALHQGDYRSSYSLCQESLTIRREIGDRWGIAVSLQSLGAATFQLGDQDAGRSLIKESLTIQRELQNQLGVAAALASLARYAEDSERSARLWGATQALREHIGAVLPPAQQIACESEIAAVRKKIGEAAFAVAWAQGSAMSMEDACACALEH